MQINEEQRVIIHTALTLHRQRYAVSMYTEEDAEVRHEYARQVHKMDVILEKLKPERKQGVRTSQERDLSYGAIDISQNRVVR